MQKFLRSENERVYNKDQVKAFIIETNKRKLNFGPFGRGKFEHIFSQFCIKYLKDYEGIQYDFSTLINSELTLEKESKLGDTTIRQLLNTFVSTVHCLLKTDGYGKLYKSGGESVRYYTKEHGEQKTNDIDSKFCCLSTREPKQTKEAIFQIIAIMIILLAQKIKLNDFKVESREIENIGYVTSFDDEKNTNPIHDYIVVRTNYVGACYEEEGKENPDCMNVISIDINNRIVLDKLARFFNGEHINLYINGTPYDFLFTNKSCNDIDIKERGDEIEPAFGEKPCLRGSVKPPLASLYFIITDLITLLTPRDYKTRFRGLENLEVEGDLERRIETKKHKKDINRYIGFMNVLGTDVTDGEPHIYTEDTDQHILNRIIQLIKILREMNPNLGAKLDLINRGAAEAAGAADGVPIDLIDPNIRTENLDKKCDSNIFSLSPCNKLKQELISFWDIFKSKGNFGQYNKHSLKLRKILDMEPPGAKKTVTISP